MSRVRGGGGGGGGFRPELSTVFKRVTNIYILVDQCFHGVFYVLRSTSSPWSVRSSAPELQLWGPVQVESEVGSQAGSLSAEIAEVSEPEQAASSVLDPPQPAAADGLPLLRMDMPARAAVVARNLGAEDLPVLLALAPLAHRAAPFVFPATQFSNDRKKLDYYQETIALAGFSSQARTTAGLERRSFDALVHLAWQERDFLLQQGFAEKGALWQRAIQASMAWRINIPFFRQLAADRLSQRLEEAAQRRQAHRQQTLPALLGQMMLYAGEPKDELEELTQLMAGITDNSSVWLSAEDLLPSLPYGKDRLMEHVHSLVSISVVQMQDFDGVFRLTESWCELNHD